MLRQQQLGSGPNMGAFGAPGNTGFMGMPSAAPLSNEAAQPPPAALPLGGMLDGAQRVRFASQLAQLATMGFTNESACLQALVQHNGRVDAALDALLASA